MVHGPYLFGLNNHNLYVPSQKYVLNNQTKRGTA